MNIKSKGGKATVKLDAAERRMLSQALSLCEDLKLYDKGQDAHKASTYLVELIRRTDMETGEFKTGDAKE